MNPPPALPNREFLMKCSGQELADFLMVRHAKAANFRRELFDLIDRWVEAAAEARLAAEVNAIRQELKHASALPFPKKVEEPTPHGDAPPVDAALQETDHRRGDFDTVRRKHSRQFVQR